MSSVAITIEQLKEYAQSNPDHVKIKWEENGFGVVKYSRRVFYDDLWNDVLEECRGMVIDRDWNIISLPFHKIYNLGIESRAPRLRDDEVVKVYDKINGFMAAATYDKPTDSIVYSTTGSLTSEYVGYIKRAVADYSEQFEAMLRFNPNHTFLFECVDKDDPHIIPTEPGMYYLGKREKNLNSKVIDHTPCLMMPDEIKLIKQWECTVSEMYQFVKGYEGEGLVIESSCGMAKIKTPYYLTMKFLARRKSDRLELILKQTKWKNVDEEFYPLMNHLKSVLQSFSLLTEQGKLEYLRTYFNEHLKDQK